MRVKLPSLSNFAPRFTPPEPEADDTDPGPKIPRSLEPGSDEECLPVRIERRRRKFMDVQILGTIRSTRRLVVWVLGCVGTMVLLAVLEYAGILGARSPIAARAIVDALVMFFGGKG